MRATAKFDARATRVCNTIAILLSEKSAKKNGADIFLPNIVHASMPTSPNFEID
jgi:hypothetical protein